jgi:glycosyltransferase involved in cell wall biosynthesis
MRFCHVTTFYPPYHFGGDAILTQGICEGLARRGHDVTVVHSVDAYALRGKPVSIPPVDPPGIHRHALRSALGPLAPVLIQQTGRPGPLRRPLEQVLHQPFDVVHFHNISLIGGPGVLPLSRAPVTLYTTHDHWLECTTHVLWKNRSRPCDTPQCLRCALRSGTPPQFWRLGGHVARSLEHVDLLIAPSQFTADRHRAAGITRPIRVLPSFTSHDADGRSDDERATAPFVCAGRLVSSKGVEPLLAAFAQRPAMPLLVVGDGPLRDALQTPYARHPHITFRDAMPHAELMSLFARARAVLLPSWGPEVFPLTVIEAMASGTPVIVRRAGGSAEAVERTGGGVVYDSAEALLPVLDRFVSDAAWRRELSSRARDGVARDYREDTWMTSYLELIEDVARRKRVTTTR